MGLEGKVEVEVESPERAKPLVAGLGGWALKREAIRSRERLQGEARCQLQARLQMIR